MQIVHKPCTQITGVRNSAYIGGESYMYMCTWRWAKEKKDQFSELGGRGVM